MAEVFKAKTFGVRGFERLLVIKRILPHLSKDEEFVEMFIDEAKISVELTHANICQVTDLGKISDNYFIAMEYIDGKDLRAILKKCYNAKTPLPIPLALYISIETLKGLDYAHRKSDSITGKPFNVIHRDISPQNIMVSYEGEVKIVDFGIAKTESKLNKTQAGVLKGKFGYMSPEQASGLELDLRTDVFSAGILLFEMLTGRRLFLGDNDFETLEKIKECVIPSPSKYNPEIFPELEQAVKKALAKEREDRFTTAQEMQAALSKIFYTTYSEFSGKDLSHFLRNLFAEEIEKEQESLRRALDALPPAELAAAADAAEAANDRIIESGSRRFPAKPATSPSRRNAPIGAPSPPTNLPIWKKLPLPPWAARAAIVVAFFVIGGWIATRLFSSPPPLAIPQTPTPAPSSATVSPIEILSDPAGATVSINGKAFGMTPLSIPLERKKLYELRLDKEGYHTKVERFLATEDQSKYGPYELEAVVPHAGTLNITSNPPGAKISIDQTRTRFRTPATLGDVTLNEMHKVKVELDGYKSQTKTKILKKAEEDLDFNLDRNVVTLHISVKPENASIYINGRQRGVDADDLVPGKTYAIRIEADGYETIRENYKAKDQDEAKGWELRKKEIIFGTISLGAIPWANVFVDGKEVGVSPILDHKLTVGEHSIVFRNPDYKPVIKKVKIQRGKNPDLIYDFKS